jgi:tetratricopeptide (TPR) repeat protein
MEGPAPRPADRFLFLAGISRVTGFLACLLIPFLGGNHLSLYYVTIDRFWLESCFTLFLLLALAGQVLERTRHKDHLRASPFLFYFLPLFFLCSLSLLYTWSMFHTLNELNMLVWALGGVLLYSLSDREEELQQALILGSLLLVLAAVIQLNVLLPKLSVLFQGGRYGAMVRDQVAPFGSYLNQNMLGGYFLFTLPLAFSFALTRRKWIYLLAAATLILGVLLSLSRLAMIIGFGGLFSVAALTGRKIDRRWFLKLVVSFACALTIFFLLLAGERREETSSMRTLLDTKVGAAYHELPTLDKRTEIWGLSLRAVAAEPTLGHGGGTFEYAFRTVLDGGLYTKYAHGSIVKLAVELGIVGLLAYLFYLWGFAAGVLSAPRIPEWAFLALSATSGALFSMLDFGFDMPAHVITFFMLSSAFFAPSRIATIRIRSAVLLVPVLLLLLCSFLFTLRADTSRKLVEDGIAFEEGGLFTEAYLAYRDSIESMPLNPDAYARMLALLTKSRAGERNERMSQQLCAAVRHYAGKAEALREKNAELLAVQGAAYSRCSPGTNACEYLVRARELYPSSAHYMFETAGCFAQLGDFGTAIEIARGIGPFLEKMRIAGNPEGLFVYKLKDLEADLELSRGNVERALALARINLASAERGELSITHVKAHEFLPKDVLVDYLRDKVRQYEKALTNQEITSLPGP